MSDSPLDLAAGFLAFPRGLTRWSLWKAMSINERMVVVTLLVMARFAPGEGWYGSSRFPLDAGELNASEETIAAEAGVTRKIVRTCVRKLLAAGFLGRRKVHPAGRSAFVLTVRDYSLLRQQSREEGPRQGQQQEPPEGQERAHEGPTKGQRGALTEQRTTQGNNVDHANTPTRARARAGSPAPADAFAGARSGPVPLADLVPTP